MIELQSVVSQRATALQLVDALLKAEEEARRAVLDNLGEGGGLPPVPPRRT